MNTFEKLKYRSLQKDLEEMLKNIYTKEKDLPILIGPEISGTRPMAQSLGLFFSIKPEFQNTFDGVDNKEV